MTLFQVFSFPVTTFASPAIQPTAIITSSKQIFTVTIYSEKNISTVGVKLLIPTGITQVIPYVKSGWTINTIQASNKVTEIDWSDGEIPTGQQDIFSFTAKAPAKPTTLLWKISQIYADNSVTTWDQNPNKKGVASAVVTIISAPQKSLLETAEEHTAQKADIGFVMSIVGIVIASVALSIARRKNPRIMLTEKPHRQRKH